MDNLYLINYVTLKASLLLSTYTVNYLLDHNANMSGLVKKYALEQDFTHLW